MSSHSLSTYQTLRKGALRKCLSPQLIRHQSSVTHAAAATERSPSQSNRQRRPELSKDEFFNMKKLTRRLVDHSQKHDTRGWKSTPSLRHEEMQLGSVIKRAERAKSKSTRPLISAKRRTHAPSKEKEEFMAFEDFPEVGEYQANFQPGTFIETNRNEISTYGLVLGEIYADQAWRLSVLMSSGEVWLPLREDVTFSIPNAIPEDHALRCGLEEVASTQQELNARVQALKKLRALEKAIEDAYGQVCQKAVDVYSMVKASDPNSWTTITVPEVVNMLFPNPTTLLTMATHKYLMQQPYKFVAHHIYRASQMFHVRPQSHVEELETVKEWVRMRGGPIDAFASKSREIIEHNKQLHLNTHNDAPSQRKASHSWTKEDKTILSFLLRSLRPWRSTQADPYSIGQSSILRRIYPQFPLVNDAAIHQLLIDLGVLAPWQDLTVLRPDLGLDLTDEATSATVRAQDELVQKSMSSRSSLDQPLGPEDFYPSDPLEALRYDFGDKPVYVIDDEHAEELDDGVSIEPIPEEPEACWIHVHIADPASVLPPTHVLSKEASKQMETLYFLQRSWPLFPRSLMHSPSHGLSLGARPGEPTPVLSFSAKVDSHGELLDTKVRPGLIRNIQRISYDQADMHLFGSLIQRSYPFGCKPQPRTFEPLAESQSADLRQLLRVAEWMNARRLKDGTFTYSDYRAGLTNFAEVPSTVFSPTLEPYHFSGFPTSSYTVTSVHDGDSRTRNMVAEVMKIACRAASRFCLERNVPVLRRTAEPILAHNPTDFQKLLDQRTPNGYILFRDAVPLIAINPAASYSLEPKGHFGLGVPDGEGYVRVTSPLRRYADLVAHWQIHRALLGEKPYYDTAQLQDFAIRLVVSDRLRKRVYGHHEEFWNLMFIKRWIENVESGAIQPEVNPLDDLEGHTLMAPKHNPTTRSWQTQVSIPKLGLRARLGDLETDSIPLATVMPIKFSKSHIRLGTMPKLDVESRS
ncbi:hypothetical protein AX16_002638 [Volvariella volvacea WC 439]|nr:hypothetical protein AX16_002638 [Volvariella volvacea WC 439]